MNEPLKSILETTIYYVLQNKTSDDVYQLIDKLDIDSDINGDFCDEFELGEWFYTQLELNDIEVLNELDKIASDKLAGETEQRRELKALREGYE